MMEQAVDDSVTSCPGGNKGNCGNHAYCWSSCAGRCPVSCLCIGIKCQLPLDTAAVVNATDFCFPPVYTVSVATWDASTTQAEGVVVRHDAVAGVEREDHFARLPRGDVRTGYVIRDYVNHVQYKVAEADDEVVSCSSAPLEGSLPETCLARGAVRTGSGTLGRTAVSYWRQRVSGGFVDVVVDDEAVDASGVMTVTTSVSSSVSSSVSVQHLSNFNTGAIDGALFTPPAACVTSPRV